jgi:cell division protein FtsB
MGKRFQKIATILLTTGLIFSLSKNIFEYHKKEAFYKNYQSELDAQKRKQLKLKSEIARSKDYYFVEKNIREKLNLLKPDEIQVILPQPTVFPTPTIYIKQPPYRQWIDLFL